MRGAREQQMAMLTTLSPEDLVPAEHPIRRTRKVVDDVLASLDPEFEAMYSWIDRPSVPPEQLLEATVLLALYSIRSERAFCERLNYDLLFKWFWTCPSTLRSLSRCRVSSLVSPTQPVPLADPLARRVRARSTR